VELACPTPFAIEEMEVGGIENVRLRCPSPITRKMNQFSLNGHHEHSQTY